MDHAKRRGRGKLLKCFKPEAGGDHDELIGRDLAFLHPSSGDESGDGREIRKKKVRRGLLFAAKAVFSRNSLLKKFRGDQNPKQDSDRFSTNLSSKSKKFVKSVKKNFSYISCWDDPDEEINNTLLSNSNSSSLLSSNSSRLHKSTSSSLSLSSLSSSSSFSANSRSQSNTIKRSYSLDFGHMSSVNRQKSIKRESCARKSVHNYNHTLEMNIFLVCFVVLVFLGKVFAIVTCTSTLLFFAPGRRLSKVDSGVTNDVVVYSDEYKKRVIMEGLLERNRSRVL